MNKEKKVGEKFFERGEGIKTKKKKKKRMCSRLLNYD
jgi:hypothetical protein